MKKPQIKNWGIYALIIVLALFIGQFAIGNGVLTVPVRFEVVNDSIGGIDDVNFGDASDSATQFTNLQVNELTTLTGTTTVGNVTLGAQFNEALNFAAAATTTPGGLFSIQNTGVPKLCRNVIIYPYTSGGADSVALVFGIGTSTSATSWSGAGNSIMATTTLPTNTTAFLSPAGSGSNNFHKGAVGTSFWVGTTTSLFLWGNGVYLNGAFDASGVPDNSSSTGYTSMAGEVYVDCITQ